MENRSFPREGPVFMSKLILSFDMLAGRLEIFPMLMLFAPSSYRRK